MNRRELLGYMIITPLALSVPFGIAEASTDQYNAFLKIIDSFPRVDESTSSNLFVTIEKNIDDGITIKGITKPDNEIIRVNSDSDLLIQSEQINEGANTRTVLFSMHRAANKIAKDTLRARGNHYSVIDNSVYVWYRAKDINTADTPLKVVDKNNVLLNDNFSSYFFRIDNDITINQEELEHFNQISGNRFTKV